MKTIGLIGGMSWESTVTYYQLINEAVKQQLGGLHSAKILLYSVDFAEIEEYQARGQLEESAQVLVGLFFVLPVKDQVVPKFAVVTGNIQYNFVPFVAASEVFSDTSLMRTR